MSRRPTPSLKLWLISSVAFKPRSGTRSKTTQGHVRCCPEMPRMPRVRRPRPSWSCDLQRWSRSGHSRTSVASLPGCATLCMAAVNPPSRRSCRRPDVGLSRRWRSRPRASPCHGARRGLRPSSSRDCPPAAVRAGRLPQRRAPARCLALCSGVGQSRGCTAPRQSRQHRRSSATSRCAAGLLSAPAPAPAPALPPPFTRSPRSTASRA